MISAQPVVCIHNLSLAFRGMPVLEDIHLELDAGDFVGIIGPNGGGKSVLLKVILGLLKPDRGRVEIFGRPPQLAHGRVAYVPQVPGFDPAVPMTVLEMVLMGRLAARGVLRRYEADDRRSATDALAAVHALHLATRLVGRLSGGQLQRVLIARALAVGAELILLDEPAASLDPQSAAALYEQLAGLSPPITLILVSHDLAVISRHVRSVACLNRRLHYHHSREISREMVEATYGCEVDFLVHQHTHRVLADHTGDEN